MKEKILNEKDRKIEKTAQIIRDGGLVLFPTETVYGIGANALNDNAVKKIYIAKGRETDIPLILHISDMDMLSQIADNISELEYRLMDVFWPGPFTIVLNKKDGIANIATCNGNTVWIRMPSNKIAHDLIKKSNCPIAAPSANISGKPSGTRLQYIIKELQDKVDYVLDGGEADIGLESTVVRIIDNEKMIDEVLKRAKEKENILILTTTENKEKYEEFKYLDIGSKNNLLEISHNIFSLLRKIDTYGVDFALIEGVKPEGLGLAIMNRLIRACEHDYIELN